LIVFSYHKSGTSLLLHVMTKVSQRLGLSLVNHFGLVDRIAPDPDVVLLPHSLLSQSALAALRDRPHRAIRMIRDPRDIWVSGYLYHQHCVEHWCTNTNMDPTPPIGWPQVDYSFAHLPEDWKRQYLDCLKGKSYQQNLLDRDEADGLEFELNGYTRCTLAAMREWTSYGLQVMDVKLEAVMANFDGAMLRIFGHFGFTAEQSLIALDVARSEDIRRMDDATLATRPQVHSRVISKWSKVLSPAQIAGFEAGYGDLIRDSGYELAAKRSDTPDSMDTSDTFIGADAPFAADVPLHFDREPEEVRLVWPPAGQSPEATGIAATNVQTADVWLSADGATIRPLVSGPGICRFVVPSGTACVRLESRNKVPSDPGAPYLGGARSLGLRVSDVAVWSRSREVVIPADDPRLISGWHEAERSSRRLWRWTDGSAELPWSSVAGPAVVTVRFQPPEQYPDVGN
jgi:hypothetical protein